MPRNRFIPAAAPCLVLVALVALLGLASAAPARADMCSNVCGAQGACSNSCEVCARGADNQDGSCSNGTIWTTCGDQGYACISCYPNWHEYGRVRIGVRQKNYFFYCEQYSVDQIFQTDLNHCQPNRTVCEETQVGQGYGLNVSCCAGGMCWGQQGC